MTARINIGELRESYDALLSAAKNANARQYLDCFIEEGELLFPHLPAIIGRAAITAWITDFFSTWAVKIDNSSIEAVSVGERVAFVRWNGVGAYRRKDGSGEVPYNQKYLDTLVKSLDGVWRFAEHMINSNVDNDSIWPLWVRKVPPYNSKNGQHS